MISDADTHAEAQGKPIDIAAGRRSFLKSLGLGAGIAGAGLIGATIPVRAAATVSDVDLLNYALNLEYLEAEFYLRAAYGTGLTFDESSGKGTFGTVAGGRKVNFATKIVGEYAKEIASDEKAHVLFLRSALGANRVARPTINFTRAFTIAARAAGLIGPGEVFDAFANENNFLLAAFIFEDVGVTAYSRAIYLLEDRDTRAAAASIMAVEAYHAGEVRTVLYSRGFGDATVAISNVRDSVDGSSDKDQGAVRNGVANIVPADGNGLAYARTPDQVLNIVYLGGQANDFGFFPNRLNGTLR